MTANLAAYLAATESGRGTVPALAIALGVGIAVGFVNGLAIGVFRVNPLIMTLGMASILLGIVTVGLRGFLAGSTNVLDARARGRLRDADRPAAEEPHRVGGRRRRARARPALVGARADDLRRRRQPDRLPPGRRARVAGAARRVRAVRAARRHRRAAVLRDDRLGRRRPDEQLPAAVGRRDRDRRDVDPRRHRRLQRHDPRRADPHRAQPAAAAPRRQRGVQADAVRRHRARRSPGCTSASPARSRASDERSMAFFGHAAVAGRWRQRAASERRVEAT